jgi:acetyl esterase/lipase
MDGAALTTRYDVAVEEHECPRPDGSTMALRIARPKGPGPFPAAIDIHGGAWVLHDRHWNGPIDNWLAAQGIVMAAPEFRKPPEGKYPVSIADNHLAVRWLRSNARALGSRPELVGAIGTSSGGHQLMLCALRPFDPRYGALGLAGAESIDATLRFAVACWSVFDPLARYRMVQRRQVKNLLDAHAAYWTDEAEMAEGNPQLILERGEAGALPPLLVIQGTRDDNLTDDMADRFAGAYRSAGGEVTLRKFEGMQHAFINREPDAPATAEALSLMADFILGAATAAGAPSR